GRRRRGSRDPARSSGADDGRLDAAPAAGPPRHGLLERGRNCDTIRGADRFAMLVDGDAYFSTLRAAL
ncbi:hypothetical protein QM306_39985, partial [Burkholderia cenocepacia]|nr:hypothetical protein [Burkholderia cenocepacia]